MATKKRKRRIQYGRIIDLIICIVFLIITIFTLYKVKYSNLLPTKYMLVLLVILLLLNAIFMLLIFKRQSTWAAIFKRFVMLILCAGMLFVSNTIGAVNSSIENFSSNTSTTIKMSIIVPTNSQATTLEDLQNASIGVQISSDLVSSEYMRTEMNKVLGSNFDYSEYPDYSNMAIDMTVLGNLDAMAISDSYLAMLDTNMANFKGSYKVIKTYSRTQESSEAASTKDITKEPFTVYITGMDELGSPDQNLRSDVNILLMINPTTNHIQMVSLPRDAYIANAGWEYRNDKLTHTGLYGADATVQSVENFLGIDIDFYAKVSFSSLIEIVDLIGGIDVDVEISFCEQDEYRDSKNQICLDAGQQTLNGGQALAYSRHRHTEGYDNPGRERAQQRIIAAIVKKLISAEGIANINQLIDAVPNYVLTNMAPNQITSFIKSQINDIKPWQISSTPINLDGINDTRITSFSSEYAQDVYLFNQEEIKKVLYAYQYFMQPFNLSHMSFDMNDLYASDIPLSTKAAWDYTAINPH